jgi:hypothetical protein
MDRDKLDFVIVGGIGVAVLVCLVAAILRDLGLRISFYVDVRPDSPTVFLVVLGCGLLLFLPVGFYLERHMTRRQSAKPASPSRSPSSRQVWRAVDSKDRDEANRVRSGFSEREKLESAREK